MKREDSTTKLGKVVEINEERIGEHLSNIVRGTVEENTQLPPGCGSRPSLPRQAV